MICYFEQLMFVRIKIYFQLENKFHFTDIIQLKVFILFLKLLNLNFFQYCCLKYFNFCFQFGPRSREAGDPHEETQAGPGQHQEEGRKAEEEPEADGQEGRAHAQVQRTLGSSESSQVKKIVTDLI